ncbi:hypothetical protein BC831DRAFT_505563, partial [Entophlyctis helioformis]
MLAKPCVGLHYPPRTNITIQAHPPLTGGITATSSSCRTITCWPLSETPRASTYSMLTANMLDPRMRAKAGCFSSSAANSSGTDTCSTPAKSRVSSEQPASSRPLAKNISLTNMVEVGRVVMDRSTSGSSASAGMSGSRATSTAQTPILPSYASVLQMSLPASGLASTSSTSSTNTTQGSVHAGQSFSQTKTQGPGPGPGQTSALSAVPLPATSGLASLMRPSANQLTGQNGQLQYQQHPFQSHRHQQRRQRLMTAALHGATSAISASPDAEHAVVAGREVLMILRVGQDEISEVHNLRVGVKLNQNYSSNDVRWAGSYGSVKLWDLRAKGASALTFEGRAESVRDVQFNPISVDEFAAAFESGSIQKWDIRNPSQFERKWSAHNSLLLSIDWHANGRLLASGGRDRAIKVWDTKSESRKPLHTVQTIAPVSRLGWRPGFDLQIASCAMSTDFRVHIWDVSRPFVPQFSLEEHTNIATGLEYVRTTCIRNRYTPQYPRHEWPYAAIQHEPTWPTVSRPPVAGPICTAPTEPPSQPSNGRHRDKRVWRIPYLCRPAVYWTIGTIEYWAWIQL